MNFKIISLSDFPRLKECIEKLSDYHNNLDTPFKGSYPFYSFNERIEQYNNAKGSFHIEVLEDDNNMIMGFCIAYIDKKKGEIEYLFVNESLRKMGYGEKFMESALTWLKENGAESVELIAVDGNPTVGFYEKYGFITRSLIMHKAL